MSWIALSDIDLIQGDIEIVVRGTHDLRAVVKGWILLYAGDLYELEDGTSDGRLFLSQPWSSASAFAVSAKIIPVNAPIETLLRRLETSIEQIQAIKSFFEPLSFDGGRWPLLINAELDGIEAVPPTDFLNVTGLSASVNAAAESAAVDATLGYMAVPMVSGEPLEKGAVVALGAFNNAFLAQPDNPQLTQAFGINLTTVAGATPTRIQVAGAVRHTPWTWTPNQKVYLRAGGTLSHTPPSSGEVIVVGLAIKADTLVLNTPRIN